MTLTRKTPLARGSAKLKRKRIAAVSRKRRAYRESAEGQEALAYMRAVKMLPCVVCGAPPPSEAHHCQSGRFSAAKASDYDTIPLCPPHHRHEYGPGAYHYSKSAWEALHGPDTDYIAQTRAAVRRDET